MFKVHRGTNRLAKQDAFWLRGRNFLSEEGCKGFMLKSFLQGKWLRHPLHPVFAHLPVGLWPTALLLDIFSQFGIGGNTVVRLSLYCILFGLAATLMAVPTGIADWMDINRNKPAWKMGLYHMALNAFAAVLFAVNAGLRWSNFATATKVAQAPFVLTLVGVVVIFISGYIGGRLIYDRGVSVARMSKKSWRKVAEAGGANLPPEKEKK
jgi:uncharacterized membrane protein